MASVKPKTNTLRLFFITLLTCYLTTAISQNQRPDAEQKNPLIIRSGVSAVSGFSDLYLANSLRAYPANMYYRFDHYFFIKAGAMITVQPAFLGKHFQLVTDPSFCKYSWGNFEYQQTDSIGNAIDIDVETMEFPISLRFTLMPSSRTVLPFIRGGYSLAWIIEKEAQFQTKYFSDAGLEEYYTEEFPFARFQHSVFISAGVEFNFRWIDYTLELVCQKGEGIDNIGSGNQFMSLSNTTNYYLQLAILF